MGIANLALKSQVLSQGVLNLVIVTFALLYTQSSVRYANTKRNRKGYCTNTIARNNIRFFINLF